MMKHIPNDLLIFISHLQIQKFTHIFYVQL